MLKLTKIKT